MCSGRPRWVRNTQRALNAHQEGVGSLRARVSETRSLETVPQGTGAERQGQCTLTTECPSRCDNLALVIQQNKRIVNSWLPGRRAAWRGRIALRHAPGKRVAECKGEKGLAASLTHSLGTAGRQVTASLTVALPAKASTSGMDVSNKNNQTGSLRNFSL